MIDVINDWFDTLPRPWRGTLWRRGPTFRACGVAGFYVATITTVLGALLLGLSVWGAALLSLVAAASFFLSTYLRRMITGREQLVLLEQVWFAEILIAALLWWLALPLWPHLDVLAVALCPFLAFGRVGCLLVGCCYGQPAGLGIAYSKACADAGFPRALVGVRLLPVQMIEMVGLTFIGLVGAALWLVPPAGGSFVWFLAAYGVMRFGLEELRGDVRPNWLGLSQAQWMSLVEIGFVLWLTRRPFVDRYPVAAVVVMALAGLALVGGLIVRRRSDRYRTFLRDAGAVRARVRARAGLETLATSEGEAAPHGAAISTLAVDRTAAGVSVATSSTLAVDLTPAGVSVATSRLPAGGLHVSLSLPDEQHHLRLLSAIAARALPEADAASARTVSGQVLHLRVHDLCEGAAEGSAEHELEVYGHAVRSAQRPVVEPAPAAVREDYFGAREA